jgi:hypothetical protein
LNPYARQHIRTVKLVQGIPIVTSILQPTTGALSSSSSTVTPDQDSTDDYPEIRKSTCGDPAKEGRLIVMVAPKHEKKVKTSSDGVIRISVRLAPVFSGYLMDL